MIFSIRESIFFTMTKQNLYMLQYAAFKKSMPWKFYEKFLFCYGRSMTHGLRHRLLRSNTLFIVEQFNSYPSEFCVSFLFDAYLLQRYQSSSITLLTTCKRDDYCYCAIMMTT